MLNIIKKDIVFINSKKEQFYCEVCNYPFLSSEDFLYKEKYCACHECFLNFIEPRKDAWKKGWRPKQDVIDTYKENKKQLYSKIGAKSEI